MAEEGPTWTGHCLSWGRILILVLMFPAFVCILCNLLLSRLHGLELPEYDIAELQLNYTRLQQDPRLHWQGGPALGRSFLHGPQLDNGQLRIQRDGIYRLHIQVTLANCSSPLKSTTSHRAILSVGICSPATHTITLLRLNFQLGCTVTSQRLSHLAAGDTLCTNLTVPLLPSQNADETFFGVQWVHT
ncbi:CD70 antigen [Saccopteryx bilineata]|uniref:CD70 antigen n=1 Tax=Saccopteryx bilineata TaxID=59482 RepID=UPI00338E00FE